MPPKKETTLLVDQQSQDSSDAKLAADAQARKERLAAMQKLLSGAKDDGKSFEEIQRLRKELELAKSQLSKKDEELEALKLAVKRLRHALDAKVKDSASQSQAKDAQLDLVRAQLQEKEDELRHQQELSEELHLSISELEARILDLNSANDDLANANGELEQANRQLSHEILQTNALKKKLEVELADYENTIVPKLEARISESEASIKKAQAKIKEITSENEESRRIIAEKESVLSQSSEKNAGLLRTVTQLKEKISENERQITSYVDLLASNESDAEKLRTQISSQRTDFESRITGLQGEISKLKRQHESRIAEITRSAELQRAEASRDISDARDEATLLTSQLEAKEQTIARNISTISLLEGTVAEVREELSQVSREKDEFQRSLEQEQERVATLSDEKALAANFSSN